MIVSIYLLAFVLGFIAAGVFRALRYDLNKPIEIYNDMILDTHPPDWNKK